MLRLLSLLLACIVINPVGATTLLVLGDSLSAGYQMPIEKAWPSLLPNMMAEKGKPINVINGRNSLARLPKLLTDHSPDYVLIELGANDGLRGFSPSTIENNLSSIISHIKAANAAPVLMQIHVLPNYGKRYTHKRFRPCTQKLPPSIKFHCCHFC